WGAFSAIVTLLVIAFHEAGHAIAMRLLGYRNVHVYFVPLLGAMTVAAVDRPISVRKEMIVLLAGPVPGLCLAIAFMLLAPFVTAKPALVSMLSGAFALVLINALNLLPFTPLDGGKAVELLTHPDSVWRLAVGAVSVVGLAVGVLVLRDPVV